MDELVEEAGLPYAGLADHGDHLTVALAGPVEAVSQLLQLRGAADEAREPPPGRGLEAGASGTGPRQLEDLDGLGESLDRHGAERLAST